MLQRRPGQAVVAALDATPAGASISRGWREGAVTQDQEPFERAFEPYFEMDSASLPDHLKARWLRRFGDSDFRWDNHYPATRRKLAQGADADEDPAGQASQGEVLDLMARRTVIERKIHEWEIARKPTALDIQAAEVAIQALHADLAAVSAKLQALTHPEDVADMASEAAQPSVQSSQRFLADEELAGEEVDTGQVRRRDDLIWPVIEEAQKRCADKWAAAHVWPPLAELAKAKVRPFIGATEEGLQYLSKTDDVAIFTVRKLRDKLRKRRPKAP